MYHYCSIDEQGYTSQVNNIAVPNEQLFCIKKLIKENLVIFNQDETYRLFYSMVKPILCYGSEVLGTEYSDVIKYVHFNFCKYFLEVINSVNNAVAFGECGHLPLCVTHFTNCINYWCKLLHMQNNRYPNNCYKMLKAIDEASRQNLV